MTETKTYRCYLCGEAYPLRPDQPGANHLTMYEGADVNEQWCRAIVICMTCVQGDFDMWTDEAEWNSHNPVVPYRLLPTFDHDDPERDDPSKYPSPQALLDVEVENNG